MKDKIDQGIKEFYNLTFFSPNWLKCNLRTREYISHLINNQGYVEGFGLRVFIDYEISDMNVHIGMGNGPTYTIINLIK